MTVTNKTAELFVSDLLVALAVGNVDQATRRVRMFQVMHLPNDELQGETMSNRRRLALLVETGEVVICDEYYPEDNGRVHIVPSHSYATFHKNDMALDWNKVAIGVTAVLYDEPEWPKELEGQTPETIAEYMLT